MFDADKSISGVGKDNSTYRTSRSSDTGRPTRAPDDQEGFKKTVERRQDSSKESDDSEDPKDQAMVKQPHGLFDLANPKILEDQASSQQLPASPFALMSKATDADASADLAGLPVKAAPQTEDSNILTSNYVQVRDDISGLNQPTTSFMQVAQLGDKAQIGTTTNATLQTLIDQIVDKLYTVTHGGVTDTVMMIKNPPVLAGSELVLTSFDTAKGEFNIAFTNLTQAGKTLLDSLQANLLSALEKQGYVTHIVVTTTEPYRNVAEATPAQQQEGQRRDDQQQEGRNPRQQQQGQGQ